MTKGDKVRIIKNRYPEIRSREGRVCDVGTLGIAVKVRFSGGSEMWISTNLLETIETGGPRRRR